MKKYLVDLSFIKPGKITGIERYALNLVNSLLKLSSQNKISLIILKSKNLNIGNTNQAKIINLTKNRYINLIVLNLFINILKFDYFLSLGFPILLPIKNIKILRVIHDNFFNERSQLNSWKEKYIISKFEKKLINYYYKLITVSKYSQNKIFTNVEKKISILPNCISNKFIGRNQYNIRAKFTNKKLLCVGTINERKNYEFIIKVFNKLSNKTHGFQIEIVGKFGWNFNNFLDQYNKSNFQNKIFIENTLTDDELILRYQQASILLVPSHDEGFCIPIIEAQYFGTPVIVNNINIFHEVGEDSLLYEYLDENLWVDRINNLLSNFDEYLKYSNDSILNSSKYLPEHYEDKLYEILQS